jgi:hypothetical protein
MSNEKHENAKASLPVQSIRRTLNGLDRRVKKKTDSVGLSACYCPMQSSPVYCWFCQKQTKGLVQDYGALFCLPICLTMIW